MNMTANDLHRSNIELSFIEYRVHSNDHIFHGLMQYRFTCYDLIGCSQFDFTIVEQIPQVYNTNDFI